MNKQLEDILQNATLLQSELWLLCLAIAVLLLDIFSKNNQRLIVTTLAVLGLIVNYFFIFNTSQHYTSANSQIALFSGSLTIYPYTYLLQYLFNTSALFCVILGYFGKLSLVNRGEYLALLIFMLLGTQLLTKPANFLMLYLSIELISFSAYVLTFLKWNKHGSEGSLKYLLFGAFCTACMLYGISLVYAFTGSISFDALKQLPQQVGQNISFLVVGLIFIGLLFKLAAFPFQSWAPDTYQAAPTPFVTFLSVTPKIAAVFVVFLLSQKTIHSSNYQTYFQYLLTIVTLGSILYGNLAALWQKNAKRLLAYSSIAHTGFLLLPLFSQSSTGLTPLFFYAVIFVFMNTAAFAWVHFMEIRLDSDKIEKLQGCGKVQPISAIWLLVIMISLTGLPITAGFTAKLFVFSELWQYVNSDNPLLAIVFVTGLLNVLIALYYYLQFPYYAFFKTPPVTSLPFKLSKSQLSFITLMTIPLLVLFFKPDWLLAIISVLR